LSDVIIAKWCRYGVVLAKDKNEEEAMRYFIQSVNLYPMNWGCWLEMTSLIGRVEDVSIDGMETSREAQAQSHKLLNGS